MGGLGGRDDDVTAVPDPARHSRDGLSTVATQSQWAPIPKYPGTWTGPLRVKTQTTELTSTQVPLDGSTLPYGVRVEGGLRVVSPALTEKGKGRGTARWVRGRRRPLGIGPRWWTPVSPSLSRSDWGRLGTGYGSGIRTGELGTRCLDWSVRLGVKE